MSGLTAHRGLESVRPGNPQTFPELERELASVVIATDAAVAITDRRGRLMWVNPGWERMTGYAFHEVEGESAMHVLLGPAGDTEAARRITAAVKAGKSCSVEIVHHRKDGTPYWVDLALQPILNDSGEPERYLSIGYNITERKSSEQRMDAAFQEAEHFAEALAYSRQQLEMILLGANLGEWVWDPHAGTVRVNPEWIDSLGLDLEGETTAESLAEWVHPDDLNALIQAVNEESAGIRDRLDIEFRLRDRHGNERWILTRGGAVDFGEDGTARRLMGTMLDISDRKLIEEELRAERSLMQNILSTIPMGVYWRDEDGNLAGCNDTFAGLMGLDKAKPSGEEAVDPEFWAMVCHRDRQVLDSGIAILDIEETFVDRDGLRRYVMASHAPLRHSGNRAHGVLGVYTDVTATKQLEAQLATSTRLEAIGQLAAGIAHEINTPMQYIGDNTQFLAKAFDRIDGVIGALSNLDTSDPALLAVAVRQLQDELDAARVDFLRERIPRSIDASREGIEAVSRIVRAMKDFSHPGSETMEFCDLNAAIETTITVARNEWKYAATVEVDLDDTLPLVPCLPGEINQALLNIVVNAAHAICDSHPGNELGTIAISTRHMPRAAVVTITDDGGGIPPGVLGRIFEPFFTTKPVGQGTGQGLAISHQIIVNRHGGTIDVDTTEGVGTTFTIVLPLGRDKQEVGE